MLVALGVLIAVLNIAGAHKQDTPMWLRFVNMFMAGVIIRDVIWMMSGR